ncbi:hypothetical protein FACS189421_06980 [Bacteroidia bacterium]|nr:hypothetical protein FACS189421_06980 [Bacteroidia bacterium]
MAGEADFAKGFGAGFAVGFATDFVAAAGFGAVPAFAVAAGLFLVAAGFVTFFKIGFAVWPDFAAAGFADLGFAPVITALAFQPNRFNLPTTEFFVMPSFLPISAVDRPFASSAFNFPSIAGFHSLVAIINPLSIISLEL